MRKKAGKARATRSETRHGLDRCRERGARGEKERRAEHYEQALGLLCKP